MGSHAVRVSQRARCVGGAGGVPAGQFAADRGHVGERNSGFGSLSVSARSALECRRSSPKHPVLASKTSGAVSDDLKLYQRNT